MLDKYRYRGIYDISDISAGNCDGNRNPVINHATTGTAARILSTPQPVRNHPNPAWTLAKLFL